MGKDINDPHGTMLSKLKHAFSTYDSASKKYLSAVKDVDSALEGIAIAFRELSQGETDPTAKAMADKLCSAIDGHKSAAGSSKDSKSNKPANNGSGSGTFTTDYYHFSNYMTDFAKDVTATFSDFRELVKQAEKIKDKRDDAAKSYHKLRVEVDEKETSLAKKNKGIADDPKYAKLVAKRDEARISAETQEQKFQAEYDALMRKRSETLKLVVRAMGTYSAKYYAGISKVMQGGD